MVDYFQDVLGLERALGEDNAIIAPPFGDGLQLWLKRSPGFNLDKVNTPLRVVGIGRSGLLDMWGLYAGLHYLKKPVDLIMLNAQAHVLTNPAQRLAARTGTLDWFRSGCRITKIPVPPKRSNTSVGGSCADSKKRAGSNLRLEGTRIGPGPKGK